MTPHAYLLGVSSIKEQLSRYTHNSILNCTLDHLSFRNKDMVRQMGGHAMGCYVFIKNGNVGAER